MASKSGKPSGGTGTDKRISGGPGVKNPTTQSGGPGIKTNRDIARAGRGGKTGDSGGPGLKE